MRKLFLSLILSLFVFLAYAEGISNYKELLAFAKAINKEADISMWQDEKGVVCLNADIDMKKGKKFPTIKTFNGKFDGCGHKLYNWNAKSSLFGTLGTKAEVKNIIIDASCKLEVTTSLNEENVHIAYIAQINKGKITNCINHGSVEHNGEESNRGVLIGSIVACNHSVVDKCMNTGSVSSRTSFSNTEGGKGIRLGGLIGSCYGKKVIGGITVSRCVNLGNVSFMGDYPYNMIGGIVGESSRATVKYCVNRGNVIAVGMPYVGKQKPASHVGGITAWANMDIICCDNFGVVALSGSHAGSVGGICARPNNTLAMVDCVNYGKVSSNVSGTVGIGGIIGSTNRAVHVTQCFNHAEVVNDAVESPAWCGGIAGYVALSKGPKTGPYFRDCANYGNVTNKSTHGRSSTGGFIGSGSGYTKGPVVPITVCDCANTGKVSDAAGLNYGDMFGWTAALNARGERYDDFVKVVKPLADGSNVYGRVVDSKGMPIEGVVVSDGEQSVKTDVNGEYAMKSDLAKAKFVMISVPADYEMPLRDNRPQFFRRVPRYTQAARADFVLTERKNKSDNFILTMIGDPQTRSLKTDNAVERFRDVIIPDIKQLTKETEQDVYAICLGDLVYNNMTSYDDYMDVLEVSPVPMVSVIGNHDYDQRTLLDTKLGTPYFESYLAPLNYSFNIGKMHFVVVNNIIYDRQTDKHKYKTGLEENTLQWLENDLKYIPKETTIVICSHAPLFKERTNFNDKRKLHYPGYSALLSKYDNVYAWAGHTHQNYEYNYAKAPAKYKHLGNLNSIIVGRCIGMIRLNRELNTCGTPNGYMVAEVKGHKMEWYYKTVGHDRSYQMRLYSPTTNKAGYVKATIWNYSADTWSAIEWWENGVKVAEMEHSKNDYDPDYLKIFAEHQQQKLGKTEQSYSKPVKSPYLFRVKPSEGVRSGEVRVTDQFGVTYTQTIEW